MTDAKTGIYQITHIETGKSYIGASTNLPIRRYHHNRDLHLNRHRVSAMQQDFNQSATGNSAISFAVLEHCNSDELGSREQFHIDTKRPFYNTNAGGGGLRQSSDQFREGARKRLTGRQMRYVGDFVTPWGVFNSTYQAVDACEPKISQYAVWTGCKMPETVISRSSYMRTRYLQSVHGESVIGKTWGDIGFSFQPKSGDDTGIKDIAKASDIESMSSTERAAYIIECKTDLANNLDKLKQEASNLKTSVTQRKLQ